MISLQCKGALTSFRSGTAIRDSSAISEFLFVASSYTPRRGNFHAANSAQNRGFLSLGETKKATPRNRTALAGLIWEEALDYDVPMLVSKGIPSLSQLIGTAKQIHAAARVGKETYIYQFGDHDPTGELIPKAMEHRLDELCEQLYCPPPVLVRAALTPRLISDYDLPTRATKRDGNTHAKGFAGDSVELDALPAHLLRALVRIAIEDHISPETLQTLRAAEASERETLMALARSNGTSP
jgi:hypothetical protein